jgi:hypothetical protein
VHTEAVRTADRLGLVAVLVTVAAVSVAAFLWFGHDKESECGCSMPAPTASPVAQG